MKKRLFGPQLLTNVAGTKYTTPASTKATIRRLLVNNPTGAPVTCTISIGADAQGTRLFDAWPIPAGGALSISGPITLAAGEILQAYAGTSNAVVMLVNGDETPDTSPKKRLSGPGLLTNVAATKYTVPPGKRATIRFILVSNPTGGTVTWTISVGADAQGTRFESSYPIAAGTVFLLMGPITLEAGEVVQSFASTTNALVLTMSGDES